MCLSEGLLGVIIGGVIGLGSALVIDFLKSRRDEKRWKEEKKIQEKKSTMEYFRGNYNALAPFLALHSNFKHIFGGAITLQEKPPKDQEQADKIRTLSEEFSDPYLKFLDMGYAGLFPEDLGNKMLSYGTKIAFLGFRLKEKPKVEDWNEEIFKLINEVLFIGEEVRKRIRQLLNVESLD